MLLRRVADVLRSARRVTVLTGAGVSAASGVPTFRGTDGLWKSFRPEDLATPEAFARDPALVWEWYDWRRQKIALCQPNRAHEVLASWGARFARYVLVTQNVDGLHERAGLAPLRLHGSIWQLACWDGCGAPSWRDERAPLPHRPPRCPACGGLARPGVVWFGEGLDPRVVARASESAGCDVFITAGTSSLVYPAAGLIHDAHRRGAFTVEINPDRTPASAIVEARLPGGAEQVLDALDRVLWAQGSGL
ncbi:MAG: NAD-dependent deacetylase [Vicinamibacterales bacterium]